MHRSFLITAAAFAAMAVALGAFGAHGLKKIVSAEAVSTFETGVRYHFYHSFALLAAGILSERFRNKWMTFAGYSFIIGIVLFSGSLYALTFIDTSKVGLSGIGIITPVGGLFFIVGWIFLLVALSTRRSSPLKSV